MIVVPFFPNPFSVTDYKSIIHDKNRELNIEKLGLNSNYQFIDSGSNGIYLLLKSYNLNENSKIGLPINICKSVPKVIRKAGFVPYFFDIDDEYQLKFEEGEMRESKIKVLILPHYYGNLHPKSKDIIDWCLINSVYLISDTAQSFMLNYNDKPTIEIGNGGIYSFGPGKSSFCAGGAIVYGLNTKINYDSNYLSKILLLLYTKNLLHKRLFENSKMIYLNNKRNDLILKFSKKFLNNIYNINYLQFNALKYFLKNQEKIFKLRSKNWQILFDNLNKTFFIPLKCNFNKYKYKYIFVIDLSSYDSKLFIRNMQKKGIFIRNPQNVISNSSEYKNLSNYQKIKHKLFEISTESTIPNINFYKCANVMNAYFEFRILRASELK